MMAIGCAVCGAQFVRQEKSKRRTCSKSCASALAWETNPDERIAGITAAKLRPDQLAITANVNAERWSNQDEHEKLSASNRERWADRKPELSRTIKAAWTRDKRKSLSDNKKEFWEGIPTDERRRMLSPAVVASVSARKRRASGVRAVAVNRVPPASPDPERSRGSGE
jgi:hypothetical protein